MPSYYQEQVFGAFAEAIEESYCYQESDAEDLREQLDDCLKRVKVRDGEGLWEAAVRRAEQRAKRYDYCDNERTNRLMALCVELKDKDDEFYLSLERIRGFLGCTKATAHTKMKVLKDKELIAIVKMGSNLQKKANIYRVLLK